MKKYLVSVLLCLFIAGVLTWLVVSTFTLRSLQETEMFVPVVMQFKEVVGTRFGLPAGSGIDTYDFYIGWFAEIVGITAGMLAGAVGGLSASVLQYHRLRRSLGGNS